MSPRPGSNIRDQHHRIRERLRLAFLARFMERAKLGDVVMSERSRTRAGPGASVVQENGIELELARFDRREIGRNFLPTQNTGARETYSFAPIHLPPGEIAGQA